VLVVPGLAVATGVLELRVGERERVDDAAKVEIDVGAVVDVGVGEGVVGVGEGVDVLLGTRVCFVTEFVASVALAAIAGVLVTTAIAPINESSNNVMESTPTSSLLGVSLAKEALSERWSLPEPASTLFFIFASLD
jgi:hypothetical protein